MAPRIKIDSEFTISVYRVAEAPITVSDDKWAKNRTGEQALTIIEHVN